LYFYEKAKMTFIKTYELKKDNTLVIKLPEKFKSKKRVKVIVEDVDDTRLEKINLLKEAAKDPLFLADVNHTNSDFKDADNELL